MLTKNATQFNSLQKAKFTQRVALNALCSANSMTVSLLGYKIYC